MSIKETLERFEKQFPEDPFRQKFGDYPDHVPANEHGEDGECINCPIQCWYYDSIRQFITEEIKLAMEEIVPDTSSIWGTLDFNEGRKSIEDKLKYNISKYFE